MSSILVHDAELCKTQTLSVPLSGQHASLWAAEHAVKKRGGIRVTATVLPHTHASENGVAAITRSNPGGVPAVPSSILPGTCTCACGMSTRTCHTPLGRGCLGDQTLLMTFLSRGVGKKNYGRDRTVAGVTQCRYAAVV